MKIPGGFKLSASSFGFSTARAGVYRSSLIFAAVFLLGFALALLVIKPRIAESIETNKKVGEKKAQLDKLNQKKDEVSSLDEQEIREMVNKTIKALPSRKDIPGLVASVERLIGLNQLTLSSVQLVPGEISTESGKVVQKEEEGTLKVQLSLSGSFENVKKFLENAVSASRLLSIDSVSIQSQEGNNLNVGMTMSYFYQPVAEVVPPIDQPVAKLTDKEKETLEKVFGYEDYSQPFLQASQSSRTNPFGEL